MKNEAGSTEQVTAVAARACIFGASLDVGNRGVLALAVSVAQLIARARPGVELAYHYGNESGGVKRISRREGGALDVEVLNCRQSPRSAPAEHIATILALAVLYRLGIRGPARRNRWLRSLLEADFIGDITGGDSFADIYGFRRFLLGSLPILSVRLLGRPYTMLPQTYGPFRHGASRALARTVLHGADAIMTRDRNCVPLVRELCGRSPAFCPDVAFTLESGPPAQLSVDPAGLGLDTDEIIGFNVSGLLYMGGYTRQNMFGLKSEYRELVNQLVEALLSTTSAQLLFVPHVFGPEEQEEIASAAIVRSGSARYPGRVFMMRGALSERELKWVIGRTRLFIGSRMHACIGALSQCVPAVGLAYSDKFLGVFQSAGVGSSIIDLRKADTSEVISGVLRAWQARTTLEEELRQRIPQVRQDVEETFRALLDNETQRMP